MTQSVDPCCPPWQIVQVDSDGTDLITLSEDPAVSDLAPSYSPDGTLIVFVSDRDATEENPGSLDVYTMPAPPTAAAVLAQGTATTAARLTTTGTANDPSWGRRPDGVPPSDEFTLTVKIRLLTAGAGGRVVGSPAGIRCGSDCEEAYPSGTVVTLVAMPNQRSRFAGWAGACRGKSEVCVVSMNESLLVRARFARR